jgi:glutamyl-tRNA reductase
MKPGGWRLVACSITHRTSALEEREPLQIGIGESSEANVLFRGRPEVLESVIVSTCNRVEFYFTTGRENDPIEIVSAFYRQYRNLDISPLESSFRVMRGQEAIDHLFRVAAGIDSMVLGESQILGQIKEAYSAACAVKTVDKVLHRLFHQAFRVGKQVRSDTEMGRGACSVSSAATDMLGSLVTGMERPVILFIGINQMIKLAASSLRSTDHGGFRFANRTAEKAVDFAARYDSPGYGLDALPELLEEADVVMTSTSSPDPILPRRLMDGVGAKRRGRRCIVVDLAVPRDVEDPGSADSPFDVYDLEDIQTYLADQEHRRELAIPQAEEIIEQKKSEFTYWFEHARHEHLYNGRGDTFEQIRREELAPVLDKLPRRLQNELDRASRKLVDRILFVARRTGSEKSEKAS